LKKAGVNRYNHNLNTSNRYYETICSTHNYNERVDTIRAAKHGGLEICSGVILGMGEGIDDTIDMIYRLKEVKAAAVPVNFFLPVDGHRLLNYSNLTSQYCLKILCVFRFAMPQTEIRVGAGREYYLRSKQSLCLYIVNSIFANGYLTTGGDGIDTTRQMIIGNGFAVELSHDSCSII
jgi:biotin synthase